MTLLKRLLTFVILFVFLYFVVYMAICIGGGAVAGFMAGFNHPNTPAQDAYKLGGQAGGNFVRNNRLAIMCGALGISLVTSLALSFSGIFPWCKKPMQPPPVS